MKKKWKIAAVGLIVLLLFLILFRNYLWVWYDEIMHPLFPEPGFVLEDQQ